MRRFHVRVVSRKRIKEAEAAHPEWGASLYSWYKITRSADWRKFEDVKQTFNSADKVGTCVVFNISRNKCRLISYINYRTHKVFILYILSHAEYGREGWKDACNCS